MLSTHDRSSGSQDPPEGAWYADPYGKAAERRWDGHKWTKDVRGVRSAPPADGRRRRSVTRGLEGGSSKARSAGGEQTFTCYRCRGTGRANDLGYTCPDCLGKGRMTAEDRKVNRVMRVAAVAITIVLIVLMIVLHLNLGPG